VKKRGAPACGARRKQELQQTDADEKPSTGARGERKLAVKRSSDYTLETQQMGEERKMPCPEKEGGLEVPRESKNPTPQRLTEGRFQA